MGTRSLKELRDDVYKTFLRCFKAEKKMIFYDVWSLKMNAGYTASNLDKASQQQFQPLVNARCYG